MADSTEAELRWLGVSRSLSDAPDRVVPIEPETCSGCHGSLADAASAVSERRQVVDLPPVPVSVKSSGTRVFSSFGVELRAG